MSPKVLPIAIESAGSRDFSPQNGILMAMQPMDGSGELRAGYRISPKSFPFPLS